MGAGDTPSASDPSATSTDQKRRIQRSEAHGRRSGVGNPLAFAPLSDQIRNATHLLRSDDAHSGTSTMVSIDIMEDIVNSVCQFAKVSAHAGWWCIDQSQAEWWSSGSDQLFDQFRTPHSAQPHVESPHHSGTAVWIVPVDDTVVGVEVAIISGDPSSHPGEGKTLGESVRRPCVSLLLSDGHEAMLSRADSMIEMPFFQQVGKSDSGMEGMARYQEWSAGSGVFTTSSGGEQDDLSVRHLETTEGPSGPEIQITNPYYRDPNRVHADFDFSPMEKKSTVRNLASRLASYEALGAHLPRHGSISARDLAVGDRLRLETIEITWLSGCGITFTPGNAEVRVAKRY